MSHHTGHFDKGILCLLHCHVLTFLVSGMIGFSISDSKDRVIVSLFKKIGIAQGCFLFSLSVSDHENKTWSL